MSIVSIEGFEHSEMDRNIAYAVFDRYEQVDKKLERHIWLLRSEDGDDYSERIAEQLEAGKDIVQMWMDEREAARTALERLGFAIADAYAHHNEEAAYYRYAESCDEDYY
jgi:hypothetical protein